jgi:hypothetical protein
MSDRISVTFANVPTLVRLPANTRSPSSSVAPFQGHNYKVDVNEGCLLTNVVKYTNHVVYFIKDDARKGSASDVVSRLSGRNVAGCLTMSGKHNQGLENRAI